MKVLFIKDLRGQGRKGEKKEVKAGYANNFLIKNGYAVALNEQTLTKYNNEQKMLKEQDEQNRNNANKLKEKLEKIELIFKVKVGNNDKVFGRISQKQIKEELDKFGYDIDRKQINVGDNVDCLGYHNVSITLYKDVMAKIKVKLEK